jgi:hypothetical protein
MEARTLSAFAALLLLMMAGACVIYYATIGNPDKLVPPLP